MCLPDRHPDPASLVVAPAVIVCSLPDVPVVSPLRPVLPSIRRKCIISYHCLICYTGVTPQHFHGLLVWAARVILKDVQ